MHEEVPWDTSQENIARTQFYKSDIISVAAIHALIKSLVIERKIPTYEQKIYKEKNKQTKNNNNNKNVSGSLSSIWLLLFPNIIIGGFYPGHYTVPNQETAVSLWCTCTRGHTAAF